MNKAIKNTVFLWFGRFQSPVGYAEAARNYVEALRRSDCYVYGIDIQKKVVFSPKPHPLVNYQKKDSSVTFSTGLQGLRFLAFANDVPALFKQLHCCGKVRKIGYSFCEVTGVPVPWIKAINENVQELWTSSQHCKSVFAESGVPYKYIRSVPLCLDPEIYSNVPEEKVIHFTDFLSNTNVSIVKSENIVFLMVVSNFNRKDIGAAIRSFVKAFNSSENVYFLIKIPDHTNKGHLDKFIYDTLGGLNHTNTFKKCVKFIKQEFSFDQMLTLYQSCDVSVSTERAKGWDLPSMQAMAVGKTCIGIDWSANVEFMNSSNSLVIKHNRTVYTDYHLYGNEEMYLGHRWASFDEAKFSKAMKLAYEDSNLRNRLGQNARQSILENFSTTKIGNLINSIAEKYQDCDFLSDAKASVEWYWDKQNVPELLPLSSYELDVYKSIFNNLELSQSNVEKTWEKRNSLFERNGSYLPLFGELRRKVENLSLCYEGSILLVNEDETYQNINQHTIQQKNLWIFALDDYGFKPLQQNSSSNNFWLISNPKCLSKLTNLIKTKPNLIKSFDYIFIPIQFYGLVENYHNYVWINLPCEIASNWNPTFLNCADFIQGGLVSTSAALQLSSYMGFTKIYIYRQNEKVIYNSTSSINLIRAINQSIKCAEIFGSQVIEFNDLADIQEAQKNTNSQSLANKVYGINQRNKTLASDGVALAPDKNYQFNLPSATLNPVNFTLNITITNKLISSNDFNQNFPKIIFCWEPMVLFQLFDKYSIFFVNENKHLYIPKNPLSQEDINITIFLEDRKDVSIYFNYKLVVTCKLKSELKLSSSLHLGKGSSRFSVGRTWQGTLKKFNIYLEKLDIDLLTQDATDALNKTKIFDFLEAVKEAV